MRRRINGEGKLDRAPGLPSRGRIDRDLAAHQFDCALDERQPDNASLGAPLVGGKRICHRLGERRRRLAITFDRQRQSHLLAVGTERFEAELHGAALGHRDRVAQEVPQNTVERAPPAAKLIRQIRVDPSPQRDAFARCYAAFGRQRLVDQLMHIERLGSRRIGRQEQIQWIPAGSVLPAEMEKCRY